MNNELNAGTAADIDITPIATTSASLAQNPLLAAVKYEYSWDNKSSMQIVPRMEMFEERSKDGWQLITVIPDGNLHCFYWKRLVNCR